MDGANVSIIQTCENMWDFSNEGDHDENAVPKENKGETPAWESRRGYPKIIDLYLSGTLD